MIPRRRPTRALWLAAGWLMVAAVVWVSLTPTPPRGPDLPASDKLLHALTYFILAAWFGVLYPATRRLLAVGAALIALGAGLELAQGLGGIREPSWLDALANTLGAATGVLLARCTAARRGTASA